MFMATSIINQCTGAADFNTGVSKCPIPRGKIKGLIFALRGYTLPSPPGSDPAGWNGLKAVDLQKSFHANRPARLFPLKTVEEYEPSGGEAETSQVGYGASKITSYSPKTDTFSFSTYDASLKANVVNAKSGQFDVFLVNDSNIVFGQTDQDGNFKGIPLSGIAVGGQDFDSSGQAALFTIDIMYSDIEAHWKSEAAIQMNFDVIGTLEGLVECSFVSMSGNTYKLIEKGSNMDITSYYGDLFVSNMATAFSPSITGLTYANGVLTSSSTPKLAAPSVLFPLGIKNIEQV